MSRGYRSFVLAAVACLISATAIGFFLQPEKPNLAGDRSYREQATSYRAGGSECEPAALERLSGRKRVRKSEACQEAEEQHRESTNQLIEARRASDAADAQAIAAYKQTGIAAWGLGAGIVTLFAALGAAVFAERAAHHTMRGAVAAEQDLRPWLDVDFSEPSITVTGSTIRFAGIVTVKNIGKTVAQSVAFRADVIDGRYALPSGAVNRIFDRFENMGPYAGFNILPQSSLIEYLGEERDGSRDVWIYEAISGKAFLPYIVISVVYHGGNTGEVLHTGIVIALSKPKSGDDGQALVMIDYLGSGRSPINIRHTARHPNRTK